MAGPEKTALKLRSFLCINIHFLFISKVWHKLNYKVKERKIEQQSNANFVYNSFWTFQIVFFVCFICFICCQTKQNQSDFHPTSEFHTTFKLMILLTIQLWLYVCLLIWIKHFQYTCRCDPVTESLLSKY